MARERKWTPCVQSSFRWRAINVEPALLEECKSKLAEGARAEVDRLCSKTFRGRSTESERFLAYCFEELARAVEEKSEEIDLLFDDCQEFTQLNLAAIEEVYDLLADHFGVQASASVSKASTMGLQ